MPGWLGSPKKGEGGGAQRRCFLRSPAPFGPCGDPFISLRHQLLVNCSGLCNLRNSLPSDGGSS